MIVLCTGMIRSGSTWSYNVVKMLLKEHSDATNAIYSDDIATAFITAGAGADHVVIKSHTPDHLGRFMMKHHMCKTVYTFRNPLDSFASGIQSFGNEFDMHLKHIVDSLDLLAFQVECAGVHFVWYDEILERPEERVFALADYLGVSIAPERLSSIARMFERENVRNTIREMEKSGTQNRAGRVKVGEVEKSAQWDTGTLFSSHHIRIAPASASELLTSEQINDAIGALGKFVDETGELLDVVKDIGRLPRDFQPVIHEEPAAIAADEPVDDFIGPLPEELEAAEPDAELEPDVAAAPPDETIEEPAPIAAAAPEPLPPPMLSPAAPAPSPEAELVFESDADLLTPTYASGVFVPPTVVAWPDGPMDAPAHMLRPIEEHRQLAPPVIILKEVSSAPPQPTNAGAKPLTVSPAPPVRVPGPRRRHTQDHDITNVTRNTKIV